MTEREAKTKWCPMVRVTGSIEGGPPWPACNRWTDDTGAFELDEETRCIGRECMAYRVIEGIDGNEGYCGLAGKP